MGEVVKDGGWNQDQEWSSNSTGTFPKAVENMFDGDFSTYTYSNGSGGEVNLTGLTAERSIRVYGSTLNADSWQVTLSGSVVNIPMGTGINYGWTTVSTSFPVTVDKFRNNDGAGRIYAVEIDGKLLVDSSVPGVASITAIDDTVPSITVDGGLWEGSDGSASSGTWNKSQEWSAGGSGTMRPGWEWDQAFNGVLTTDGSNGNVAMPVENTGGASWTGNIDTAGKTVTLHYWHQVDDPGQTILINGQAVSLNPTGGGSVTIQQIDISAQAGNAITAMQINRSITTDGAIGIAGIEVMGNLLVDTSIAGGPVGATVVTKTVVYDTKLTVASDKDLDIITGGIYMTDGTPKQDGSGELEPASYTPQTSEIASVDVNDYASGWSGQVTEPSQRI